MQTPSHVTACISRLPMSSSCRGSGAAQDPLARSYPRLFRQPKEKGSHLFIFLQLDCRKNTGLLFAHPEVDVLVPLPETRLSTVPAEHARDPHGATIGVLFLN